MKYYYQRLLIITILLCSLVLAHESIKTEVRVLAKTTKS